MEYINVVIIEELFDTSLLKLLLDDIIYIYIYGVLQMLENQLLEARSWHLRGWLTNVP